MRPDISYIVRIPKHQKEEAKLELHHFCSNTKGFTFDVERITNDCSVAFIIDNEESTAWIKENYEYARSVPEKTIIGSIQLWISDEEEYYTFEFWPTNSSAGQACLDSVNLKNHLIEFVKKMDGKDLRLDYSNGLIDTIFER